MIIQHNLSALYTKREINVTTNKLSKSALRLSTGYRINSASDDAAGLQISEKMRSQIRGIEQASENISNGISLIQTADGAINEMHSILNRMTELSVQAANDTNSYVDRQVIQEEIDQLTEEIDSITEKTEFNTIPLLQGNETETPVFDIKGSLPSIIKSSADGGSANSTPLGSLSVNYSVTNASSIVENHSAFYLDFSAVNATNASDLLDTGFHTTCCTCQNRYSIKFVDTGDKVISDYTNYIYEVDISGVTSGDDVIDRIMNGLTSGGTTNPYTDTLSGTTINAISPQSHFTDFAAEIDTVGNRTGRLITFDNRSGVTPTISSGQGIFNEGVYMSVGTNKAGREKLYIQAGANSREMIEIKLPDTSSSSMGLSGGLSVLSHALATNAISKISEARNYLSRARSDLGAMQNRLEYALRNTENMSEQTQSAESHIRDVDIAKEYSEYAKYNIIQQAAQSMLSQANQQPRNILELLK